jgi:hypothetical protein
MHTTLLKKEKNKKKNKKSCYSNQNLVPATYTIAREIKVRKNIRNGE